MFALEREGAARPVRWTGLLGLLLIPVIVAGALLWGTWNADERLRQVKAAVVNLDEPVTIDDQLVPLGRQLAGGLVGGATDKAGDGLQNITWVLSDEEDAADGLATGRYAAVVTIPEDFSTAATSFAEADTAKQATIDVQTSATSKIADPVIAQAVATVAVDTTNRMLTENYLDKVYVGFNDTRKGMQELADGTTQLADGAGKLADGLGEAGTGTVQLSDGLSKLSAGSPQLRSGGSQLATGSRQLSDGLGELDSRLAGQQGMDTSQLDALATGSTQLAEGTTQLSEGTAQLAEGTSQLSEGTSRLSQGAGQLRDGAAALDGGLQAYQQGVQGLAANGLLNPADGQPICPPELQQLGPQACGIFLEGTKAGAAAALAGLQTPDPTSGQTLLDGSAALSSGAATMAESTATLAGSTATLAESTGTLAEGAGALAGGAGQLDDGIQQLVPGLKALPGQMTQLSDGVHQLAVGAGQLADGAEQFSSGTASYTGGVDQVATGAGTLADGLTQLGAGSDQLASGTDELAAGVSDGVKQAPSFSKRDRDRLSTVVSRPVTAGDGVLPDAGFAVAVIIGLALWLAGLATFLLLRAVPSLALGSAASSRRVLLRGLLPALALALAQAALVYLIGRGALTSDGAQPAAVIGFLTLMAVMAVVVNHALVAWLGGFGRILSVAVAVLAVVGAFSAATPTLLGDLRPFLPLTPAIDGLRNLIIGDPVGGAAGLVVLWLLGALLMSLLGTARKRTVTAEALVARLA